MLLHLSDFFLVQDFQVGGWSPNIYKQGNRQQYVNPYLIQKGILTNTIGLHLCKESKQYKGTNKTETDK